ncbi:hypothetical protein CL656_02870 [bacterium]|nr:hypothetical protein [bacterium]|tara:strand:- start:2058 stop:2429 length:372 start_codon:yes stop_codon:yes gene_type:complete
MNQENTNLTPLLKEIYQNLFQELGVDEMGEDVKDKVTDTLEKLAMSKFKLVILELFADKPEVIQALTEVSDMKALEELSSQYDFNPQALMNACFNEAKLELAKDIAFIQGSLSALKKEVGADE